MPGGFLVVASDPDERFPPEEFQGRRHSILFTANILAPVAIMIKLVTNIFERTSFPLHESRSFLPNRR